MLIFRDIDFIDAMYNFLTPTRTQRHVRLVSQLLNVHSEGTYLEIGCGSQPFYQIGFKSKRYIALDNSISMLKLASKSFEKVESDVAFIKGDMVSLPFHRNSINGILQWSAFGYFSDALNSSIIQQISTLLKKKGKYLLNLRNRDYMLKTGIGRKWHKDEKYILLEEISFDTKGSRQIAKRILILPDGSRKDSIVERRFYTYTEIKSMFEAAGLCISNIYGDYDLTKFTLDSPRMLIIAEKIYR